MATKCFTPLLGKRIRVTTLDSCGGLPAHSAPNTVLATDGFITLTLSAEVEDGAEIITKKADGSLCVNEKLANSFKRFTVGAEFCGVNPSLLAMLTNAKGYNAYNGDVAGITVGEGAIADFFAFEMWTGITGSACVAGATFNGGYLTLPFVVGGVLGDLEFNGENSTNFSLTGAYTKGGNQWGVGPYNVMAGSGGAASEVQVVTITGTPTGGTFTLTFNGQTTGPIAYNAINSVVQTALQSLSTIGPSNALVTGGPGPGTPYTVTFAAVLANQNLPQMTATGAFTGGVAPAVAVSTTTQGQVANPAPLPTALDPFDHLLMTQVDVAPPVSACSPSAFP